MVSLEERHVLAVLRRPGGDTPQQVTVDRIARATGMSVRRALLILEGLAERRLLRLEPAAAAAEITDSGRIALDRAGGWPPQRL